MIKVIGDSLVVAGSILPVVDELVLDILVIGSKKLLVDDVLLAVDDVLLAVGDVLLAVDDVLLAVGDVLLAVDEVLLAVGDVLLAVDDVLLAVSDVLLAVGDVLLAVEDVYTVDCLPLVVDSLSISAGLVLKVCSLRSAIDDFHSAVVVENRLCSADE